MPRVRRDATGINPLLGNLQERLRTGQVVPIISNEVLIDLALRGSDRIINEDRNVLVDSELKVDFLNYVRNHIYYLGEDDLRDKNLLEAVDAEFDSLSVSELAERLKYPSFD